MNGRGFAVETRDQAVVVIGGKPSLTKSILTALQSEGMSAFKVEELAQLNEIQQKFDPDFCLIFWDEKTKRWLEGEGRDVAVAINQLLQSGDTRIYALVHESTTLKVQELGTPSKIIYYSDYIGSNELVSHTIESWVSELESSHRMTVPGDGLVEISVLAEPDLARLIAKAVMSREGSRGSEYFLGNPSPISILNLAYLVRSSLSYKVSLRFNETIQPRVQEQFISNCSLTLKKLEYSPIESLDEYLPVYLKSHTKTVAESAQENEKPLKTPYSVKLVQRPPKTTISESLSEVEKPVKKLTPLRVEQPVFVPIKPAKIKKPFSLKIAFKKRPKNKLPPRGIAIVLRGGLIAFALYLGTLAFATTISFLSLNNFLSSLKNNQIPKSNKLSNFCLSYVRANFVATSLLPGIASLESYTELNVLLDAYTLATQALDSTTRLSGYTEHLSQYVFGSSDADAAQLISLARLESEQLYQELSLLDGALPQNAPNIIPSDYHEQYSEAKDKLAKLKRSVITAKALLATTPDIIGLEGRRKYAVLFQNNMELRATGGFIGSLAILSFENGKLYDMPIYDVYDADGQLKGHVEPPVPIKNILGEANWYLRDSNFDPDFPTSARRAEWFIKKSLNLDLDGTIAINVNTLTALLSAVGPIEIPDYNETITADNLYERAQFHAEVNFFPGSTQKKEFLSSVANALFLTLPAMSPGQGLTLMSALSDSVQEKDTLFSLTNQSTDHVFELLGWNGKLVDLPCPTTQNCQKDYLMVVDSNFGVNKANYFLKRSIVETITFDKNLSVHHKLNIDYQNTATSSTWPAGAYKNYQRLYLPMGTNIARVKIGDKELNTSDYTVSAEHDRTVLAYVMTVGVSSNVVVEVEYTTPQLPQDSEIIYTWHWQKQPGTSSKDMVAVFLNYPLYLKPSVISPEAELSTQQLKFNMLNDTDHRVTVKFNR